MSSTTASVLSAAMAANVTEGGGGEGEGEGGGGGSKWLMLTLILVPLWTMCGNLLVLVAVISFRQLRNLSNWVIASLAATDFLVALIVQPLGIYQSVSVGGLYYLNTHQSKRM